MQKALKTRQICLFLIALVPVTKLFMLPSVYAKISGQDMWISALINILIDGITLFFLAFCFRNSNDDIFTLLEKNFGKTATKIIMLLYVLFFIFKAIVPINEQKDYVELTLYVTMPNLILFVPFFFLVAYFCTKKLRVIGRVSDLLWIFTLFGLVFLIGLSLSNVDIEALLPLGVNGINKIFSASFNTFNWFGDSAYFLFFIGQYEKSKKSTLKITLSYFIAGMLVVLFMIVFYTSFTTIAFRQKFALTEISKYSTVINNIGRFDFIAIFFILFSSAFALGLPIFFASFILKRLFPIKWDFIYPLGLTLIVFLIMVLLEQEFYSIENFIQGGGKYIFIIFNNLLPLILCFIKKEKKNAIKENEIFNN